MRMSSLIYDFILFSPFDRSRFLGAYRIAKILRDNGYSVLVVDFFKQMLKTPDVLLTWLHDHVHENTVFGFSGTFMSFAILNETYGKLSHETRTLSRRKFAAESGRRIEPKVVKFFEDLKFDFPDNKIVIGGAGFIAEFLFRSLPIDHLFMGYSEETATKELVDIYKRKDVSEVIHQDPFELTFDFHNTGNTFDSSDIIFPNEVLPLEISRGCRFACKFCGWALTGRKMSDKYIRNKDKIFDELMHNYELFGTSNYNMLCDTFNESNEKLLMLKEIFDEFNKITGERLRFNSYLRLELMYRFPEQINILRDMGIIATNLGIETLHYPSAKAIGKGIKTKDVYDTISKMRKSWGTESRIHSGFIIGLPYETRETATEWLTDLYNKELDLTSWKLSPLRINTNRASEFASPFDIEADKYGYKMSSTKWKPESWINAPDGSEIWENEHWNYTECDEMVAEWTEKFNGDGVVKYADHPWGYLNHRNGIIVGKDNRPSDDIIKTYSDRLLYSDG